MTALLDSPGPAPAAEEPAVGSPVILERISANLLPNEIIATRRLSRLKRKLALGLTLLVLVLVAGYGYSWWQTSQAEDDLSSEQFTTTQLTGQVDKFAPLVQAQAKTSDIKSKLGTAMTNDVQWSKLFGKLVKAAGADVHLSSFAAEITADDASGGSNPLNNSGLQVVGDINLGGTAGSYRSVATFVNALATLKGVTVVNPASVADQQGQLTFTVQLSLTTDVLGGRFGTPPATAATTPSAGATASTSATPAGGN